MRKIVPSYTVNNHGFFSSYGLFLLCICIIFSGYTLQKIASLSQYDQMRDMKFCELYALNHINQALQEDCETDEDDEMEIIEEGEIEKTEEDQESTENESLQYDDCFIDIQKDDVYEIHITSFDNSITLIVEFDTELKNIMDIVYE